MPLNLQNDFTPHIRWMAQTSAWRKSAPDGHELVTWEHAVFDLANIETGWAIFAEGQAPEWVMDPSLNKRAAKPQDGRDWRRGFKLLVFSESALDGLREFATTAVGAARGILELYGQYEAAAKQHPGTVIQLKRPKDYEAEDGARFEIHFTKHRGFAGDDAAPIEAKLDTDGLGRTRWEVADLGDKQAAEIRELKDDGLSIREIAARLGISKGKVERRLRQ